MMTFGLGAPSWNVLVGHADSSPMLHSSSIMFSNWDPIYFLCGGRNLLLLANSWQNNKKKQYHPAQWLPKKNRHILWQCTYVDIQLWKEQVHKVLTVQERKCLQEYIKLPSPLSIFWSKQQQTKGGLEHFYN